MYKRKTIKGFLISLIFVLMFFLGIFLHKRFLVTQIFEVPNTHFIGLPNCDYRYFVISNPPIEYDEAKDLIEGYVMQYIKENNFTLKDISGPDSFYWFFYRETSKLTKDGINEGGYIGTKGIDNQVGDLIVLVFGYADSAEIHYSVFNRSASGRSYGEIIGEKEYVEEIIWGTQ